MKRALLFVSATLACGGGAMAQPYRNRPITLIVPAGGPLETLTPIESLTATAMEALAHGAVGRRLADLG